MRHADCGPLAPRSHLLQRRMPPDGPGKGMRARVKGSYLKVFLTDHKPVRLDSCRWVSQAESGRYYEPESAIEVRVPEQDDGRFTTSSRFLEGGPDESRPDAASLAVGTHADRPEQDNGIISNPRTTELDVPDDLAISFRDEREGPFVVVHHVDCVDNVIGRFAIAILFEGKALDFRRRLKIARSR